MALQYKDKRMTRDFHGGKDTNPDLRSRDTVLQSCSWGNSAPEEHVALFPPTNQTSAVS
jgi:hypothetical protein